MGADRLRVNRPFRGVDGTALYVAVGDDGAAIGGPRVAIIGWMHGDEPVGGVTLDKLEGLFETHLTAGSVLTVRANLAAHELDQRHTPGGQDLNRLWDADTLAMLREVPTDELDYEQRRTVELAPMLLECEAILDLHSTSRPAPPFLLVRDDQRHARVAAKLGVARLVTGMHEGGIASGGLCCNIGLRPGERSERLGFVFEAGQHLDPGNLDRAWDVSVRLLRTLGMWAEDPGSEIVPSETFEVMDRYLQAPQGTEPYLFAGYRDDPTLTGRRGPARGLVSFEEVEADEVVLRRGSEVIRAAAPFTMLMPAPDAKPGTDLYYVTQRRHGGLGGLYRTDDEARAEAAAIERMLDLLEDDDFARGTTWASFDSRRVLDLVAEQVGRVLRLPLGHPHRKITVVGRGDWGGGEAERRAGQRYRRAMRRALISGVPITRYQLLRGAALGWIDSLTSASTAAMMARRQQIRAARGEEGGAVDLFLSARQPHTLSLLVIGDIGLALREGDTRQIRIALVVEAATVGVNDGQARVRVVRTGLISGRPEVVRAAWRLTDALRREHAVLIRRPPMSSIAELRPLVTPEGSLRTVCTPEEMAVLRRALRRLQLGLWRDALYDVVEPGVAVPRDDVGEWVAHVMTASGIRDPHAVRSLLVEHKGELHTDLSPLDQALDEPEAFLPTGESRDAGPPHPLTAQDVDADNLERWASWKRYVRRAQVLPDTRGKDVDLALSGQEIHRRVRRLYRHAAQMGRDRPGDVMVVVAGDGHSPGREGPGEAHEHLHAHRNVVLDPNVRYLRIQHAQGAHLAWIKGLLDAVDLRPPGPTPVCLQLEGEHGALVNVVLLAVRETGREVDDNPWTLEGWRLESCGVVVTEFEVGARDYAVGLFTEAKPSTRGLMNRDLLHFARAHCEALLRQRTMGQVRMGVEGAREQFTDALVSQLAQSVQRVRSLGQREESPAPSGLPDRCVWVAEELGVADASVAAALAEEIDATEDPLLVARRIWERVVSWPGPPATRVL